MDYQGSIPSFGYLVDHGTRYLHESPYEILSFVERYRGWVFLIIVCTEFLTIIGNSIHKGNEYPDDYAHLSNEPYLNSYEESQPIRHPYPGPVPSFKRFKLIFNVKGNENADNTVSNGIELSSDLIPIWRAVMINYREVLNQQVPGEFEYLRSTRITMETKSEWWNTLLKFLKGSGSFLFRNLANYEPYSRPYFLFQDVDLFVSSRSSREGKDTNESCPTLFELDEDDPMVVRLIYIAENKYFINTEPPIWKKHFDWIRNRFEYYGSYKFKDESNQLYEFFESIYPLLNLRKVSDDIEPKRGSRDNENEDEDENDPIFDDSSIKSKDTKLLSVTSDEKFNLIFFGPKGKKPVFLDQVIIDLLISTMRDYDGIITKGDSYLGTNDAFGSFNTEFANLGRVRLFRMNPGNENECAEFRYVGGMRDTKSPRLHLDGICHRFESLVRDSTKNRILRMFFQESGSLLFTINETFDPHRKVDSYASYDLSFEENRYGSESNDTLRSKPMILDNDSYDGFPRLPSLSNQFSLEIFKIEEATDGIQ